MTEQMLCPNCMSPHVEMVGPNEEGDDKELAKSQEVEPLVHCTECEYIAPRSEFIPEDYR